MAERFVKLPPADVRDLILKMTDEEIEGLMLYFKLGVLCFLWELSKKPE